MNIERLKGLIGLSRRAGQLMLGTDMVLKGLKAASLGAVLVDETAAPNTLKRLRESAEAAEVPLITVPEELIDRATGQSGRITAGIRRGSLAEQIIKLCETAETAQ